MSIPSREILKNIMVTQNLMKQLQILPQSRNTKRGQWAKLQSFIITFSYIRQLNNFGYFTLLVDLLGLVFKRLIHLFCATEGVILCIIIGNIYQFIGHCHIPLEYNLESTIYISRQKTYSRAFSLAMMPNAIQVLTFSQVTI